MGGFHQALYKGAALTGGPETLFKGNAEIHLLAALALALRSEKLAAFLSNNADTQRQMLTQARALYCDAVGAADAATPGTDATGLAMDEWRRLKTFAETRAKALFTGAGGMVPAYGAVASELGGDGSCLPAGSEPQ